MLKRELTTFDLVLIGVGNVIGSGIFILFATILARAKQYTLLALLLAAIPNILCGLAYAELASIYKTNDLEYNAIKDAFDDNIATISTYVLLAFLIFNTATILLFAGHILDFQHMKMVICVIILTLLSVINYMGISVSKGIINTVGVVEITLLVLIALFALPYWEAKSFKMTLPASASAASSFWIASFLSLFLYSGYDTVAKLSAESVDPQESVPLGIVYTCIITTLIYLAIAAAAIASKDIDSISSTTAPVTKIFEHFVSKEHGYLVTIIGIIIVLNTFFISIISLSRFIYGLGLDKKMPIFVTDVNEKYKTPHNAIIIVFIIMILILLLFTGVRSAMFANITFLVLMMMLMAAVIILRIQHPEKPRAFKVPLNIGNIPVLMVGGIMMCAVYMYVAICCFRDDIT